MQIFEGILFFKATNNTKINHLATAIWVINDDEQKYCVQLTMTNKSTAYSLEHILLETLNWQTDPQKHCTVSNTSLWKHSTSKLAYKSTVYSLEHILLEASSWQE